MAYTRQDYAKGLEIALDKVEDVLPQLLQESVQEVLLEEQQQAQTEEEEGQEKDSTDDNDSSSRKRKRMQPTLGGNPK